jgi:predicted RNase H-like nuclease (RuvC/YqgF family)
LKRPQSRQSTRSLRHRILGIDPGSRNTGFGVIDTDGRTAVRIAAAASASASTPGRSGSG